MDFFHITPAGVVSLPAIPTQKLDSGFLWIDCIYSETPLINQALTVYNGVSILNEHLEDASNRHHPSFFDSTSRYEMIVFRGLAMHASSLGAKPGAIKLDTRPSTFFLAPGVLLTVHAQSSRTFTRLRERLLAIESDGPRSPVNPEELMLRILNDMVDRFLELREPLGALLDKAQFELLDPKRPFRDWPLLLSWRMELRRLESLSEEQLDAIQEWQDERHDRTEVVNSNAISSGDALRVRTNNLIEHINRVLNHATRLETSLESAVQLHFSSMAHRSTEIMRVLTTLTAIFMPLTLITGIFGMNFEFIPGIHTRTGFWWALGFMATIAIVMYAWFRSRRWVNTRGSQFTNLETPNKELQDKERMAEYMNKSSAANQSGETRGREPI
jgi:magnesium transporter